MNRIQLRTRWVACSLAGDTLTSVKEPRFLPASRRDVLEYHNGIV